MSDDEITVEIDTSYPACLESLAEKRRAFILHCMGNADIDGKILVQNMTAIEKWLIGVASVK